MGTSVMDPKRERDFGSAIGLCVCVGVCGLCVCVVCVRVVSGCGWVLGFWMGVYYY